MRALYFAYGSNLKLARLRGRVPSAQVVTTARLHGYRLALDKRGSDGSGKANLCREPGSRVWGVVYGFGLQDWAALDACEPGYERIAVGVEAGERRLRAETYVALRLTREPVAFDWYKRLILEGAREHGLPDEWLERLERLPQRPDPRSRKEADRGSADAQRASGGRRPSGRRAERRGPSASE